MSNIRPINTNNKKQSDNKVVKEQKVVTQRAKQSNPMYISNNKSKSKSKSISTIVIATILTCSAAFGLTTMYTNVFIEPNAIVTSRGLTRTFNNTSVESIITNVESPVDDTTNGVASGNNPNATAGTQAANPSVPGISPTSYVLSASAEEVRNILANSEFAAKADAMALAYDKLKSLGYSDPACIGLMANIASEGNYRVVEYKFSRYHNAGFYLPSNSSDCKISTLADLNYCKNFDSNTSIGVGTVQWSFGRRVGMCTAALKYITSDATCTDENWAKAEADFMVEELTIGSSYYNAVSKAANGSTDAKVWAEAFCDKYELPGGCDRNMSSTGTACITRRANADRIAQLFQ